MKQILLNVFLIGSCLQINAQKKIDISLPNVPKDFFENTNKVIIDRTENNEILSQSTLKQQFSETNWILNEMGLNDLDLSIVYDKFSKIKNLEFKIYNTKGELVKTYKKKDFTDSSLADGFSILTDNRIKSLNPSYFDYPFYTKFDYEREEENTIHVPPFSPIQSSDDRVVQASYQLTFPKGFSIKKTEKNLTDYKIVAEENQNSISYKVSNIIAPEYEELNVRYTNLLPLVRFSNNMFSLGNVKGKADNWNEFGVWYYDNFLKGLDQLPESTVAKMKDLTKDAKSDVEKARIVFEYMQNNTRYISVQVGLGGWKPFPAKDVDKLGYGDCKALTNYTKSLLESIGVKSYYTIIHSSERIRDIDENNISLQGNHVLLTLPANNENIFLECTSQKIAFGYLGSSTENRKALVVKPDGAYFVETHSTKEDKNVLKANFVVDLTNLQKVKTKVNFENKGSFYNNIYHLNSNDKKEINKYVKNVFSSLKDVNIVDYKSVNDKVGYVLNEQIDLESAFIGTKMGNDYMIAVNSFFPVAYSVKKYKNRKTGFSITRGKTVNLQTEYSLPNDMQVDFLPESKTVESKFGKHVLTMNKKEGKVIIEENFILKTGDYTKEDYGLYEKFIADVVQNNNSKLILSKK